MLQQLAIVASLATLAAAQPEYQVHAFEWTNVSSIELLTDTSPVAIDGAFGVVTYAAEALPGQGASEAYYLGNGVTGMQMLVHSECDDFVISGPPAATVTGQVRARVTVGNFNRPTQSETRTRIAGPGFDQLFILNHPAGDSSDDVVFTTTPTQFPVGSPFTLRVSTNHSVGTTTFTAAHSSTCAYSFDPAGPVMVLPDGYTLTSACAGVTDNAWAPPCPADVNNDGVLDNGDISAFVALFLASDPAADFNNDGIIDNGDIGAFVAAFLAGC